MIIQNYKVDQWLLGGQDEGWNSQPSNQEMIEAFKTNPVHEALAVCATLRPSVDIALEETVEV